MKTTLLNLTFSHRCTCCGHQWLRTPVPMCRVVRNVSRGRHARKGRVRGCRCEPNENGAQHLQKYFAINSIQPGPVSIVYSLGPKMWSRVLLANVCLSVVATVYGGRKYDLLIEGATPDDDSLATANHNGHVFNATLDLMADGDTLVIPNHTFHMQGGIMSQNKAHITLIFDGTLVVSDDIDAWPRHGKLPHTVIVEELLPHACTSPPSSHTAVCLL